MKNLEKFGPLVAAIILIWFCWSGLSDNEANALGPNDKEEEEVLPAINKAFLAMRDGPRGPMEQDPFKAPWAAQLGLVAPPPGEEPEATTEAQEDLPAEEPEPFTLVLETVLDFPGNSQARISGQTVQVGGKLSGFDSLRPPVLAWIGGTKVKVRYRGRSYVLDLWRRPEVIVDIRPPKAGAENPRRSRGRGRR